MELANINLFEWSIRDPRRLYPWVRAIIENIHSQNKFVPRKLAAVTCACIDALATSTRFPAPPFNATLYLFWLAYIHPGVQVLIEQLSPGYTHGFFTDMFTCTNGLVEQIFHRDITCDTVPKRTREFYVMLCYFVVTRDFQLGKRAAAAIRRKVPKDEKKKLLHFHRTGSLDMPSDDEEEVEEEIDDDDDDLCCD